MSDQRMHNVASLAEHWGVSDTFVYTLVNTGKLRSLRVGPKLIRIRHEWVLAYEEEHTVKPAERLTPDAAAERDKRMKDHVRELRARQRLARLTA